jgi:hypothetical protein
MIHRTIKIAQALGSLLVLALAACTGEQYGLDPASDAWRLECDYVPGVLVGNLIVNAHQELDDLRCYRVIDGNLIFQGDDTGLTGVPYVVLPWVELVTGNLVVHGDANLSDVWLPRLAMLNGGVNIDFRDAFEQLVLPQMTELGSVYLELRSMNNDFSGFATVTKVAKLSINNTHETDPRPSVNGFNALVEAASLTLTGFGLSVNQQSGVLTSLIKIQGNVQISITDDQPYGTDQIQTIGGNLRFKDTTITDLSAFSALTSVAGCIKFEGAPNLSNSEQANLLTQVGNQNSNTCL